MGFWLEIIKSLLVVGELSWSKRVKVSHTWLFIFWSSHISSASWIWLNIGIIVVDSWSGGFGFDFFFSELTCLPLLIPLAFFCFEKTIVFDVMTLFSMVEVLFIDFWSRAASFDCFFIIAKSVMAPTTTLVEVTIC